MVTPGERLCQPNSGGVIMWRIMCLRCGMRESVEGGEAARVLARQHCYDYEHWSSVFYWDRDAGKLVPVYQVRSTQRVRIIGRGRGDGRALTVNVGVC